MKFLVHATIRPSEPGKPLFTVENEFEADTWHAAWERAMSLGPRMGGVVQYHKLVCLDESGKEVGRASLALPAPAPAPVVPPEAPSFFKTVDFHFSRPTAWPSHVNG